MNSRESQKGEVMAKNKAVFVAYVPVLHLGYLNFFAKHPAADQLFLLDPELFPNHRSLVKDIRALPTKLMKKQIQTLDRFKKIVVLTPANLDQELPNIKAFDQIIMPSEDINEQLASEHLSELTDKITYDTIFLRWHKSRSTSRDELSAHQQISRAEFDQKMMRLAKKEAKKSSDWWRQVGGALIIDGEVALVVRNRHLPYDQQAYVDGDPRADYGSGEMIELTSSVHTEALLVAQAARQGLKLEGADVYVTTFPCPVCAKLLSQTGIRRIFFDEGYSLLDAEVILKNVGIELIKVE